MATINYGLNAVSTVATGGVAHILDTSTAFSTGTIVSFRENGTQFAFFDTDGHFNVNDNIRLTLGTGGDADIYYDATDLNINAAVVGSGVIVTHTNLKPNANDGGSLGISGTAYADLFLASGGVVNFNAGDITLTHSTNLLTLGGGNLTAGANTITAASILANSNDSGALGASGTAFSDLFLASGSVINWVAGDVTLTHAAGKLTFGGDGTVEIDFNNHEMTNVDINSGAIDGTTIGAASVAAGSFAAIVGTTGTYSGILSVDDTTDSTSTTTGSIHTDGGVGIEKDLILGATSTIFIGDTTNANMTIGLTINQGTADNEAIALKSSDVGHAMTAITEADTYGTMGKESGGAGGLLVAGFRDASGGNQRALVLKGVLGEVADTTKLTTGFGVIELIAQVTDAGTGIAAVGADGNLVSISNNSTTRFIFDAEGSGHADIEFTTFDKYDDIAILDDLETLMVPKVFGEAVHYDAEFFAKEGLINDIRVEPNGKTRGMMNWTKMIMLNVGAARQLGAQNRLLRTELDDIRLEIKSMSKLLKEKN